MYDFTMYDVRLEIPNSQKKELPTVNKPQS